MRFTSVTPRGMVNISLICAFIFGWGLGMSLVATGAARPAGTAGTASTTASTSVCASSVDSTCSGGGGCRATTSPRGGGRPPPKWRNPSACNDESAVVTCSRAVRPSTGSEVRRYRALYKCRHPQESIKIHTGPSLPRCLDEGRARLGPGYQLSSFCPEHLVSRAWVVACQSWYPATLGLVSRYPFRARTVVLGNRYWEGPEVGPDQYLTLWSRFRACGYRGGSRCLRQGCHFDIQCWRPG